MRDTLDDGRLKRFVDRHVFDLAVVVAGTIVLAFGLMLAWQAWSGWSGASRMRTANAAADEFLQAAVYEARERGLTSIAIGQPNQEGLATRIERARVRGDRHLSNALDLIDRFNRGASPQTAPTVIYAERVRAAWDALRAARPGEAALRGRKPVEGTLEEWLATASELISVSRTLRDHALLAAQGPDNVDYFNLLIKQSAWTVSEEAGKVRGVIGHYIAREAPVPAPVLERVRESATLASRAASRLRDLRDNGDNGRIHGGLRQALEDMETGFVENFEPLSNAMLEGATTGDYPLGSLEWFDRATAAIDSAVAVSEAASAHTLRRLDAFARHRFYILGAYAVVAVLAIGLGGYSLVRVRRYAHQLFVQKELAEIGLHSVGDAVVATDAEGRVRFLNVMAEEFTGWSRPEASGRHYSEVVPFRASEDTPDADPIAQVLGDGRAVDPTNGHIIPRGESTETAVEMWVAPLRGIDGGLAGVVGVLSTLERLEARHHVLSWHASHDALTDLVNRREFERQLGALVESARRDGGEHVLAYIDLDHFKTINDTAGHAAGDEALRRIAFTLRTRARDSDTLARLGGDEFGLMLRDCTLEQGQRVLEEIRRLIEEFRFTWEGRTYPVGASVGMVAIDPRTQGVQEVLRAADAACYAVKRKGRGGIEASRPSGNGSDPGVI